MELNRNDDEGMGIDQLTYDYNGGNSHLGSTRAVVDKSGEVLESFDYYPFGLLMPKRSTTGAGTMEKFTGKERDEAIGLDYFGARYYDPALGRFLSTDRFADKYPDLTPYHYSDNNPLGFIDINGDSIVVAQNQDLQRAVKVLRSTEAGADIYDELDNDKGVLVSINNVEDLHSDDGAKANGVTEPSERRGDKATKIFIYVDVSSANKNGGNTSKEWGFQNSNGEGTAITIGHELGHAKVARQSIRSYKLEARSNGGHDPKRPPIKIENAVKIELYRRKKED